MGFYVLLSVVFPCDRNDGVAALARRHLRNLGPDAPLEAQWFLQDLGERSGENPGPKGGLSLWGIVGNHTRPHDFASALTPFWLDAYFTPGGPLRHERIIVFYEFEQSEEANAIEICLEDEDADRAAARLSMRTHPGLPFAWGQY
ncbi:MAG: hypothetical protein IRY84_14690 [Thermobispora bispora]|nr:hypothetical protein [Thermobispora bispora]